MGKWREHVDQPWSTMKFWGPQFSATKPVLGNCWTSKYLKMALHPLKSFNVLLGVRKLSILMTWRRIRSMKMRRSCTDLLQQMSTLPAHWKMLEGLNRHGHSRPQCIIMYQVCSYVKWNSVSWRDVVRFSLARWKEDQTSEDDVEEVGERKIEEDHTFRPSRYLGDKPSWAIVNAMFCSFTTFYPSLPCALVAGFHPRDFESRREKGSSLESFGFILIFRTILNHDPLRMRWRFIALMSCNQWTAFPKYRYNIVYRESIWIFRIMYLWVHFHSFMRCCVVCQIPHTMHIHLHLHCTYDLTFMSIVIFAKQTSVGV